MKKINLIFTFMAMVFAVVIPALALSACGSDDDDEPQTPVAERIAGSYTGSLMCSVMGEETDFGEVTLKLTADGASVSAEVPAFGSAPMAVPAFTIEGIAVSGGRDGEYVLEATEFSGTTGTGKSYSGTAQGSCSGDVLKFSFSLNYGAMPMPMICSMTATRSR